MLRVSWAVSGEIHKECTVEAQLFDPDGRPIFDEPLRGDGNWPFEWGK